MSENMIKTLDAMCNERPNILNLKRKNLEVQEKQTANVRQALEWMRINAERERIGKFKQIIKDSATLYYVILDAFAKQWIERKGNYKTMGRQMGR